MSNYTITYVPGTLTVAPAPLAIRANDQAKPFGRTLVFNGTEFTATGLVNGDQVTRAQLDSDGAAASAPFSPQPYVIDISDAQGSGLSFGGILNYDISYLPGELTVTAPVLPNPPVIPNPPVRPLEPVFSTLNAGLRLNYYDDLPNPVDDIDLALEGGGGGGPNLGPARASGITAAREQAQDTLSFLEALSSRLDERVSACNPVPPDADVFLACVRDALSEYARQLDERILDLPQPLRQVSAVIRQSVSQIEGVRADTARRLALATSDAEREAIQREGAARAGAAVQDALAQIRTAIQLIRAEDDPQLASLQTQQGVAITAALQGVQEELAQAVGLELSPIQRVGRLAALVVALLLALATAGNAETRVALVIGNGAYTNLQPLQNPVNDAADIAESLRALGFEVMSGTNLSQAGMIALIGDFLEAARAADVSLFYYAGHGFQIDGRNYLVPVDAELKRRADIHDWTLPAGRDHRRARRHAGHPSGLSRRLPQQPAFRDGPVARRHRPRRARPGRRRRRLSLRLRDPTRQRRL